ncbi:MAG: serine/threonine-protein phosphatase 6 regulatory ankyrin repeat subunit B-like [Candidatus Midichloriaceae bacterium]|nr:serine/threonine-protein phosphatase 6 regulatory ankyrin repeat subunit B-like [Candidatus Midichloriaceae bacterium]
MAYKSVLIIGPRLEDSYDKLKGLYDGNENIIIGDGKRKITEGDILSLTGKIDSNTKIIVYSHAGCNRSNALYKEFDINLYKYNYQKLTFHDIQNKGIENLWCALRAASNKQPLQINLLGCFVGLAKDSVKCLPLGAVLTMYSPKDDYSWSNNSCEIIKSIMASKHLSDPFQVFLDNILTNLSNCGASIAINAPIGISHVSFVINSESLKHGVETYLSTISYEVIKFYTKNKYYFEGSSILLNNSKVAAEKFFQNENLNEPSFTKDKLDKFVEKIIESKISAKDPNYIAAVEHVLEEDYKELKLKYGNNPLHLAANKGKVDVIEMLIKKDFDVNAKNDYGNTALHLAAINCQYKAAETLIQNNADKNAVNNYGNTALHKAIENYNLGVALYLIEQNVDVNVSNNGGSTPLHYAAEYGQSTAVNLLIEKGANIHAKNVYGNTALHLAAIKGRYEAAETLIQNNADKNAVNNYGNTALHKAIENGKLEVALYLIEQNVDVNVSNNGGFTPLHYTAEYGQSTAVNLLIEKGANIHAKDNYGNTPLHLAAIKGQYKAAEALIQNNADKNAVNNYGNTASHKAIENGKLEVALYLIEQNADVNVSNNGGYTPLHYAAKHGKSTVINLLIEKGANIHAKDNSGYTPIQLAAENGHFDAVKSLLEHGAKNTGFWGYLEWIFNSSPEQIAYSKGHAKIAEYIKTYGNNYPSEIHDSITNHDSALVEQLGSEVKTEVA